MMSKMLLTLFLTAGSVLQASTFVGNGGNAGDMELQVTLNQIKKSLTEITQNKHLQGQLCACDESMRGHKICDVLKVLTQEQKQYCEVKLESHSQELLNAASGKGGLNIIWTNEDMNVKESMGMREAIGVTQPQERKIYLNREEFLELRDYERIYLMTHELAHLLKIENRFVRDDEPIGVFKQQDGGRQLLNSMGAAIAMRSLTNGGISDYKRSLRRSKSYKTNWFGLSIASDLPHNDSSAFAIKQYTGGQLSYRFQMTDSFGASVAAKFLKGTDTFFGSVSAENQLNLYSLQAHYRIFPNGNPLSFWGQSHLLLGLGIETGSARMKLDDSFTAANDEAQLTSPIISAQYYLPLFVGIWFHGGIAATAHQYEFKTIGFKSESTQANLNLGASYAF